MNGDSLRWYDWSARNRGRRDPARDVILSRLLEVLFIESLRFSAGAATSPGLVRGLADARLSLALRRLHDNPTHAWTVAQMAKEATLSRSAFFERFNRVMGVRADGIPACVAHGSREELITASRRHRRRNCRARRLQFRQHLQRGVHAPRGTRADALCKAAHGNERLTAFSAQQR